MVHTREKPYKCEICSASFTHKASLKRHLKVLHPDPASTIEISLSTTSAIKRELTDV